MKSVATLFIILTVGLFSCKNPSTAMSSNEVVPDPSKKTSNEKPVDEEITYDMIIAFISKGEGIDRKLKPAIDEAIVSFNKKHNLKLKPEILGWGREGETDYNFIFKNLSTKQKKEFISSIEEIVGSSDMVSITFNQKSVHKR